MTKTNHKKLAIIVAWLVEETKDVPDKVIEKEILEESNIPWVDKIEKVTVLERE